MSTPPARYAPHVLFQPVPGGGVLLDTRAETYFGLNGVAARICELLPLHDSVEELSAVICAEHPDVPAEVIQQDVLELLDSLVEHGLLVRGSAGARAGDPAE